MKRIIKIIEDSQKQNQYLFLINGKIKKRLFVSNGSVLEFAKGSKKRGYYIDSQELLKWNSIKPVYKKPKSYFQKRVDLAANYIANRKTLTRSFDTCFEEGDGDKVVIALMKRAAKNKNLQDGIKNHLGGSTWENWSKVYNQAFQ